MTETRESVFKTSQGSVLHYFTRGTGPPVVVLPPAWGIGSVYLQDGLRALEDKFTLIYLEFRGNGRSTKPAPEQMTCWHLAADVEHLRQELELDTIPRLVGHSGGGTIALWYAIRFPGRVGKLILLTHRLEGFDDSQSMGAMLAAKQRDPRMRDALQALTSSWDDLSDEEFAAVNRRFLPAYYHDPSVASKSPLASVSSIPLWNYQMLHGKYAQLKSQEELLDKVTANTLMIFADDDPICNPEHGLATKKGIADSELVVLEKCGHFPWMERTDETLSHITRFFST
ncbi:uncharacterized protein E0L32_002784 [Thyridium curvatum]|uniref:AB hydrolase-1 domain-containing protein n=1 Tax=Thyridium curvatum TaxID=1093900 RepID=A0A507B578_9PEZI|nr:uncharacterized protein E0L32_002784 [Thyridium curvatum]TPX18275.1 hypothetical protein E0L32_002784 [Thyridium curvatum]